MTGVLIVAKSNKDFVSDFLYQHRVAFDGATSEVEVLDTCGCAVSVLSLLDTIGNRIRTSSTYNLYQYFLHFIFISNRFTNTYRIGKYLCF